MFSLSLASALFLLAGSTPSAATPLAPASKWLVEFADNRCVASRIFAASGLTLSLGLDQSPAADGFVSLYLLLPPGDLKPFRKLKATVSGSNEEARIFFADGVLKDGRVLIRATFSDKDLSALRAGGPIELISDSQRLTVPLSGMDAVSKVLDRCTDDLLDHWGYGKNFNARVASMPTAGASIASLFADGDYPSEAIRMGQQGRVEARLTVGVDGKPTECAILRSSGAAALDQQSCAIPMRRARFSPARDREGKPIVAPVVFTIRWAVPQQ